MDQTARELLRAIRGELSQVAFSRRLGYASNIAADWEGGRRFPTAEETVRAADRRHVDVRAAFTRFHPRWVDAFDPNDLSGWLSAIRGTRSNRDIAAQTGFSEHRVGRWMRGASRPRLPQFLALVEGITHRCSDWVGALVPIEQVPSLRDAHATRTRVRRLVYDRPWTAAILTTLGVLQPHPDPVGRIAETLGVDPVEVAAVIGLLQEAGVVGRTAEGLRVVAPLTVDAHATTEDLRRVRLHWSAVAHARLQSPAPTDRFAYNVFNVSRADLERIHALQAATYQEIRSIVAGSEAQVSALLVTHLLAWAPADPAGA